MFDRGRVARIFLGNTEGLGEDIDLEVDLVGRLWELGNAGRELSCCSFGVAINFNELVYAICSRASIRGSYASSRFDEQNAGDIGRPKA